MLRISIVERRNQRRLVLEGKLVTPWANELKPAYEEASTDLNGRQLVIDVKGLTTISGDGENVLLELTKEGASFRRPGVFTKHILKRLAHKVRRNDVREGKR
jgi:anti-anti-sigma regulatory factor